MKHKSGMTSAAVRRPTVQDSLARVTAEAVKTSIRDVIAADDAKKIKGFSDVRRIIEQSSFLLDTTVGEIINTLTIREWLEIISLCETAQGKERDRERI